MANERIIETDESDFIKQSNIKEIERTYNEKGRQTGFSVIMEREELVLTPEQVQRLIEFLKHQ